MARAVLFGTPVSPGIAIGRVRFMHKTRQDDERRITAAEVAAEQETLRAAAESVRASLAATMENVPEDLSEYRDVIAAQMEMAKAVESPAFQSAFNIVKGSVPARTDVSDEGFDDCGKQGIKDLKAASEAGTLLGSMGHGHANPAAVKNAMYDVITAHFNGEYDSKQAAEELAAAVEAAQ